MLCMASSNEFMSVPISDDLSTCPWGASIPLEKAHNYRARLALLLQRQIKDSLLFHVVNLQKNANLICLRECLRVSLKGRSEIQFNQINISFARCFTCRSAFRYKFVKRVTFVFLFLLGYQVLGGSSCCRQLQWNPFNRRRSDCEISIFSRPCKALSFFVRSSMVLWKRL